MLNTIKSFPLLCMSFYAWLHVCVSTYTIMKRLFERSHMINVFAGAAESLAFGIFFAAFLYGAYIFIKRNQHLLGTAFIYAGAFFLALQGSFGIPLVAPVRHPVYFPSSLISMFAVSLALFALHYGIGKLREKYLKIPAAEETPETDAGDAKQ